MDTARVLSVAGAALEPPRPYIASFFAQALPATVIPALADLIIYIRPCASHYIYKALCISLYV
jgi:hypothetical protein